MVYRLMAVFALGLVTLAPLSAQTRSSSQRTQAVSLPGLQESARLVRDREGITHISARREADVWFMQGWVHARDRLFQMDQLRRTASGTLAELFGRGVLASDVELRTLGLRRAGERSQAVLSASASAALKAYAQGVNAYVTTHALPPEYKGLEITRIPEWTPLDTLAIVKLLAAQLSLDFDADSTYALDAYKKAGNALGFSGDQLYFDDLNRAAPFDTAATVLDATQGQPQPYHRSRETPRSNERTSINPTAIKLARSWDERLRKVPALDEVAHRHKRPGSNLWAVSGTLSATGRAMMANDRHLTLGMPAIWYPVGLDVPGQLTVFGDSLVGAPAVLGGYNNNLAWGSTNTLVDVTDTFQEQLVRDPRSPSGWSSTYKGQLEPVIPIPQTYRYNTFDGVADTLAVEQPSESVPAATLIVPRRNNGPIMEFDPSSGVALSVQWAGFSGTREIDAVLGIVHAKTIDHFVAALQNFDVASQNWVVADARGQMGYFTSGEVPVREDLQAGYVDGLPPNFIRNGQGGNEWLPVAHPQPNQALPFEILPFSELPQVVNPSAGFFVNANNDPLGVTHDNNPFNTLRVGGGIFYLAYNFDDPTGLRAGQITDRLKAITARRRVRFEDMQSIQADVVLRDAKFFVPHIIKAMERGRRADAQPTLAALAGQAKVSEAVGRLKRWNFTSPTGLTEGWDVNKPAGEKPSEASIDASVAATIYNLWRSQFIANTVDKVIDQVAVTSQSERDKLLPDNAHVLIALRNLLDSFGTRGGVGASGVDFFSIPGVADAQDRRDITLLKSVAQALDMAASDAFKPAFANSTRQADYRWGRLHRIVFASPLGAPFSIPSPGTSFPPPLAGLDGIPTDGGFNTVDDASFKALRVSRPDDFMFAYGPSQRMVVEMAPGGTSRAENIWPGGTSSLLESPFYAQFLKRWLANDAIPLQLRFDEFRQSGVVVERFGP